MALKNIEKDKEIKEAIDQKITSILVVNNSKLKPFIELFESYPENILLKPLGTLVGFFKINDNSEDSSYIVNFLTSILKKEYYANHKRNISDSFDSALKKVNLALSELAKQGNINWISNLNAAICVIEKNNLHFTVCGKSKILLLRNGLLSEISQDLASDLIEPNPMKTFIDVSSGKLLPKDKLIISSEDLFNLFNIAQLKKSALRFSNEEFSQFVKTALVNELKIAGTIVIDMSEPKSEAQLKSAKLKKRREDKINAFSEKTFRQANRLNINDLPVMNRSVSENKDYVDQKTGHIYVQGENKPENKESESWQKIKEFIAETWFKFKENFKIFISRNFKKFKNWISSRKKELQSEVPEKIADPKPLSQPIAISEAASGKNEAREKISLAINFEKLQANSHAALVFLSRFPQMIKVLFSKITPNFRKIIDIFENLGRKQKISALIILLAIIIVPYIYVKYQKKAPKIVEQPVQIAEKTTSEILSGEKNLKTANIQDLGLDQKTVALVSMNGSNFAISDGSILSIENQKPYPLSDISNVKFTANMDVLNLIFLLDNNGRVVSFSPISGDFKTNNISIPENSQIKGAAAFFTYLYLADSANNQIYRYPRAEGGFGAKTNWLRDTFDLKNTTALCVEENIYLLKDNQIIKLFKGRQEGTQFEALNNEARLVSVYTNENTLNLYALDSKYGRIIKFAKTGELQAQYQNDQLKGALNFSIDEANHKFYFISNNNNAFSGELN